MQGWQSGLKSVGTKQSGVGNSRLYLNHFLSTSKLELDLWSRSDRNPQLVG